MRLGAARAVLEIGLKAARGGRPGERLAALEERLEAATAARPLTAPREPTHAASASPACRGAAAPPRGGPRRRREAAGRVAALRALLGQLGEADPFPGLGAAAYLGAFWPWLLAGAGRWPAWAVEYALAVGGLPAAAGRLARGGPPPAPRPLRTAGDVVALLHEQVEAARADVSAAPLERARVIGQLAGQARRAIETGGWRRRLEALGGGLVGRRAGERYDGRRRAGSGTPVYHFRCTARSTTTSSGGNAMAC